MSGPTSNTGLINDFIDIIFDGGLIGTDKTGADKTSIRVRLGDSVTIKTNLPDSFLDDIETDADARSALNLTNVATQDLNQYSLLLGNSDNSIYSMPPLLTGEMLVGRTGNFPTPLGPLTNGQLLIGNTGSAPTAAIPTSPDSSIAIASGAGSLTFSGKVIQQVRATSGSSTSTATVMPIDDTIPQITEGAEVLTATITPKSSSNILIIEYFSYCSISTAGFVTYALFQDSTANAIQALPTSHAAGNTTLPVYVRYYMAAGTTSATTFRIRFGPSTGTGYDLRASSSDVLGGSDSRNMVITEYAP